MEILRVIIQGTITKGGCILDVKVGSISKLKNTTNNNIYFWLNNRFTTKQFGRLHPISSSCCDRLNAYIFSSVYNALIENCSVNVVKRNEIQLEFIIWYAIIELTSVRVPPSPGCSSFLTPAAHYMALLAGILWDLDGVLVDTGELHYQSWAATLAGYGFNLTFDLFRLTFGMNNHDILTTLYGQPPDLDFLARVTERKEGAFREMVRGQARTLPGVLTWLNQFRAWRIDQAVASSAPMENIVALINELDLKLYFTALVSGYAGLTNRENKIRLVTRPGNGSGTPQ